VTKVVSDQTADTLNTPWANWCPTRHHPVNRLRQVFKEHGR
jgi:hypothetical protein